MRLELDTLIEWLHEHLYVTVAEAKARADLYYDEWTRFPKQQSTTYFVDLLYEASHPCNEHFTLYKV